MGVLGLTDSPTSIFFYLIKLQILIDQILPLSILRVKISSGK